MDEKTINELFRLGILNPTSIRKLNVVNSILSGVRPTTIARRLGVCRQYVYKIKKGLNKNPDDPLNSGQ